MFDGTSLNYNGGGGGGGGALSASFSDSVTTGDIIDFQLRHLHCLYTPNNHLVVKSSHLTVTASRQKLLTGES